MNDAKELPEYGLAVEFDSLFSFDRISPSGEATDMAPMQEMVEQPAVEIPELPEWMYEVQAALPTEAPVVEQAPLENEPWLIPFVPAAVFIVLFGLG